MLDLPPNLQVSESENLFNAGKSDLGCDNESATISKKQDILLVRKPSHSYSYMQLSFYTFLIGI